MNCPFHVLIYKSRTAQSYRELPLRLAELGTVYRYERSGVIHGLLRARGFTQDDSHIFCTADQIVERGAGLPAVRARRLPRLRLHRGSQPRRAVDPPRRRPRPSAPTRSGRTPRTRCAQALDESGLDYVVDEGEGAFYGPKIDLQVTDAIGRAWQLTTVQVDFNLPQRFDLSYAGADGAEQRPYMVHRALYGSLDRFFGILLEHYAGAFPTWLAPVQAVVDPGGRPPRRLRPSTVAAALAAQGLRVEVDDSADTMGAKIRKHQLGARCPTS